MPAPPPRLLRRRCWPKLGVAGAVLCLPLVATAAVPAVAAAGGSVSLVGYSTPKPAYTTLVKDFDATAAGRGVSVSQSFGASGSQATAVIDGLPADVVNLALAPDVTKLVKAGLVAPSWDTGPTKGFVTDSIVSFVVRTGNPKHLTTWADLVKPGVKVITPNPFSSGSAKWNIMAAYGAQLALGKSKAAATSYLGSFLRHAAAQPSSASNALQTFLSGEGDVLLDYEDDALYAQGKGEPVTVVTPPQTILIQNPIALTKSGAKSASARSFVNYLLSPAGQAAWAELGYRPVLPQVAARFAFPAPKKLFTIAGLGGWTQVNTTFFTPGTGTVARIEAGLGLSTSG